MNTSPGTSPLRILHLEDEPRDAFLVRAALDGDGLAYELTHVQTRAEFTSALARGGFDLILSDFALPTFDGLSALQCARDLAPDVPFVFVSGTLGEESAIAAVRNGATDYVLKHRLSHLAPAVRRALGEAQERARRRETEEALRRSEEQLRQAQKMEAVGRLAAGVAHDFNNMLTAILGYAGLARMRLDPADPVGADLDEISKAGERAAGLTRQLLAFSRQQVLEPRIVDLNTVLADMDRMARRLIGADIDLLTAPGAELGRVRVDPGQMEQVLLNLVVNARDAMPDGGKLTIETADVELDGNAVQGPPDLPPGRYVMVAVSDTGCGMDAEVMARIFEPFYTTKEAGRGTGLGLSTVHGIVKQSDGHIEVYSEVGSGTTFKIYLPRVEQGADAPRVVAAEAPRLSGGEIVLLVEDEELIRRVVSQSLELQGYKVIAVEDGSQALEFCQREEQPIDLLLTDVVMPLMSGPQLVERVSRLRPELPVLYVSGYTDRALIHSGQRDAGSAFLQKPFTPDVLARKVREVLDRERDRRKAA